MTKIFPDFYGIRPLIQQGRKFLNSLQADFRLFGGGNSSISFSKHLVNQTFMSPSVSMAQSLLCPDSGLLVK